MRRKLIGALVLLIGAVVASLFLSEAPYDLGRVDPRLRGLATPYQSVNVGINGFKGDIWMRILDRDGHQLRIALPASVQASNGKVHYTGIIVGAEHSGDPKAVAGPLSDDTRKLLIATIDRYRRFSDSTDFVLLSLRGAPEDHARYYGAWVLGSFKRRVR